MKQFIFWRIVPAVWFFIFLMCPTDCRPQGPLQEPVNVHISLLSESKTLGQDKKIWFGLRAQMAPGWKTYWRSPGVAGYGARLNWEKSENIKSAQILWPLPRRFQTEFGTVNGYNKDIVLPISVEVIDISKPVRAIVQIDMLVCDKSLCVPVRKTLSLDLPVGPRQENKAEAFQIRKFLNQVPLSENNTSIQIQKVEVSGNDTPPTIRVLLSRKEGFTASYLPDVFMEIKGYFVDMLTASLSSDHKTILYSALVYPDENRMPSALPNLVGMPVKLTVGLHSHGRGHGEESHGFEVEKPLQAQSLSIWFFASLLLVAFVGGFILNFMPCVLPVLSLKVLSVMRQGGQAYKDIRQEFMATVFGIIFSFLALALGSISLKASGSTLGWGVQFQEPIFVTGLIGILTIFSASLFGFFEFQLPSFLSSIGGMKPHHENLIGSFFEGSLVTLLATPCTAPLVGTALAFSLSRGPFEIISIFCVMGLGLAFPFLLMALFPSLAAKLPKPGTWMVRVKNGLGFLLILTVFWLLFILREQIGIKGTALITALMALVLIVLASARFKSSVWYKKVSWLIVSTLIGGSLVLSVFSYPSRSAAISQKSTFWQPFEADKIQEYVKAGKIVFVNVTADWCLTCQVNKYFSLKNQDVLRALSNKGIVAMEADWTNPNPKIATYLESFQQYGIPFYAVYGCRNPKGTFLGQVLTPQKVIDALNAERCSSKSN